MTFIKLVAGSVIAGAFVLVGCAAAPEQQATTTFFVEDGKLSDDGLTLTGRVNGALSSLPISGIGGPGGGAETHDKVCFFCVCDDRRCDCAQVPCE
jgi:hypothetical protein